jgi:hypothetical protein
MLEIINAYKRLRRNEKIVLGVICAAEATGDVELLIESRKALAGLYELKHRMWRSPKLARQYNIACIEKGF